MATGLAVVVAAGAAWWLLRPPPAPIESALPSAAQPDGASPGPPNAAGSAATPSLSSAGASANGGAGAEVPGAAVAGSSTLPAAPLVVHASGAVASPGVYRLAAGARVDDLIRAAGGVTADGDADRVNLAAPLVDGERVWVPRHGETEIPSVVAGGGAPGGGAAGGSASASSSNGGSGAAAPAVIDLNTATAEELDSLPGVGPATATAILTYRDQNGPFSSVDELLEVRGIGEAKLEQIRPLVRT